MTAAAFATFENEHSLASARLSVGMLEKRFADRFEKNLLLNRSLVSFQANRAEPIFRWFKYREGFSRQLIAYLLDRIEFDRDGLFLDPFAGTGASAFVAADYGMNAIAIELLPVGAVLMATRQHLLKMDQSVVVERLSRALKTRDWRNASPDWSFPHLTITRGAFPDETERKISKYKTWLASIPDDERILLEFALFSILEEISYTRKDGQYLRWDRRAPRLRSPGNFDKGEILDFDEAIVRKLENMVADLVAPQTTDLLSCIGKSRPNGTVRILQGSTFEQLSLINDNSISLVITSPPYCNRYDYTRTYALELAYLGVTEDEIKKLRQTLLTCTVENKPKDFFYVAPADLRLAQAAFEKQSCLQSILQYLEDERLSGNLNNNGIVRMVKGYFYDSCVHLAQIAKKVRSGGVYVMVNDNVRYNGLDVPVDCILSSIAEDVGFRCEKIWVLPVGKGNSSQQMKRHGRSEIRKCVYVWRRI